MAANGSDEDNELFEGQAVEFAQVASLSWSTKRGWCFVCISGDADFYEQRFHCNASTWLRGIAADCSLVSSGRAWYMLKIQVAVTVTAC